MRGFTSSSPSRSTFVASGAILAIVASACAQGSSTNGIGLGTGALTSSGSTSGATGGSGGSSPSASSSGHTSTSTSTSGTTSGSAPSDCAQANGGIGCCEGDTVYFCKTNSTTVTVKPCTSGEVCGWDASKSYYYCVPSPGGPDPSGANPIACQ